METGASRKGDTSRLAPLIGGTRQGYSLVRYVNPDDIEAKFEKVERVSSISASPVDDFNTFRPARITA